MKTCSFHNSGSPSFQVSIAYTFAGFPGQWWFKRALFYLGGQPIGCHWWEGDDGHTFDEWKECTKTIGFGDPYRMAIHNALQGSLSIPGYTGTTIFRTFAPDHFEDGQWHNGGKCVRTSPGGVPMTDLTKAMYDIQIQEFQNVTGMICWLFEG